MWERVFVMKGLSEYRGGIILALSTSTCLQCSNYKYYLLKVRKCKGYILAFLGVVYIYIFGILRKKCCVSFEITVNSGMPVIIDILMFIFCRPLPFVFIPLIAIRKWNNMWKQIISYHCVVSFLGRTHPFLFSERNLLNTL